MENSSSQCNENPSSLVGYGLTVERQARNLSQAAAAAIAGVSREQWGKYERGISAPGADTLAKLQREGFDVIFVLTGERGPGIALSDDEKALVERYRLADEKIKAAARAMLNMPAATATAGPGLHVTAEKVGSVSSGPIGKIVQNF